MIENTSNSGNRSQLKASSTMANELQEVTSLYSCVTGESTKCNEMTLITRKRRRSLPVYSRKLPLNDRSGRTVIAADISLSRCGRLVSVPISR